MNEKNVTALNSEVELANAVEEIKESIEDLKKLKKASATLEEVGDKNSELAEHLFRLSALLRDAAKYLSEDGIKMFNETLGSLGDDLQRALKDFQNENSAQIQKQLNGLGAILKKNEEAMEKLFHDKINSLSYELDEKLQFLKYLVIGFGVVGIALLGYVAFFG